MQESIIHSIRQIPKVTSVKVLDSQIVESNEQFSKIEKLLQNRTKMTLIGKSGCAVFFRKKTTIIMIQSDANVNLGALDILLESIE